jgi:hypothetical protein
LDKNGKPVLDKIVGGRIWASQLEMAFAKYRDEQGIAKGVNPNDREGLNRIGNGGYANHVMQAFTGKPAELYDIKPSDSDKVWAILKDAQEHNKLVVAGTATRQTLKGRLKEAMAGGQISERSKPGHMSEDRWVAGHAFTVWGSKDDPFLFEENGVKYIRLRNPWGSNPPGGVGRDGVGTILFSDFMLHYDQMYVGSGSAKAD